MSGTSAYREQVVGKLNAAADGIGAETRAQCEDAIRVLDAIIARDAAHEVWLDAATGDATASAWKVWEQAIEHAQHQIEMYRARYGASR